MQWGLPGPRAVLVHRALQGCRDLQDHQVTSYIAKVPLDKLDLQATWGLQESQVSMGAKGSQASCAQTVLVSQGLRVSQGCQDLMA